MYKAGKTIERGKVEGAIILYRVFGEGLEQRELNEVKE